MDILTETEEEIKMPCPDCEGHGIQYVPRIDAWGDMVEVEYWCEYCQGAGELTREDIEAHPWINYYRAEWAAINMEVAA